MAKEYNTITINVTLQANKPACNISVGLKTEKGIYSNGDKIIFTNTLNQDIENYSIDYWIEDLYGNIVKEKYTTKNLNPKSYTPKYDSLKVLLVKNVLHTRCDNIGKNSSEIMLVVKPNKISNQEIQTSNEGNPPATTSPENIEPKIKSFYTLTKKYHEEINLYANIEGGEEAILIGQETKTLKLNGSGRYVFKVQTNYGNNTYFLILNSHNRVVDTKSLTIYFDNPEIDDGVGDIVEKENPALIKKVSEEENTSAWEYEFMDDNPAHQNLSGNDLEKITGLVYESSEKRKSNLLIPILVCLLVMGGFIFFYFDRFK